MVLLIVRYIGQEATQGSCPINPSGAHRTVNIALGWNTAVHHRLLSVSCDSALGRLYYLLYCFAAKRYPDPFHFRLCRPGQQDCQIVVACETPGLQSHRHTALQFNWSPCKGIALRNNLILRLCFTGIALAVCSSDCAGDRSGGQD